MLIDHVLGWLGLMYAAFSGKRPTRRLAPSVPAAAWWKALAVRSLATLGIAFFAALGTSSGASAACTVPSTISGANLTFTSVGQTLSICITNDQARWGLYPTLGLKSNFNAPIGNTLGTVDTGNTYYGYLDYTYTTANAVYLLHPVQGVAITGHEEVEVTLQSQTGSGPDSLSLYSSSHCTDSGSCVSGPQDNRTSDGVPFFTGPTDTLFTISATLPANPEIAVSGSIGGAVADGGTLAQGNQVAGSAQTITFTVTNSGNANLTLNTATSSGPSNVTVNSITAPLSGTVAGGGGTTTFTVQYTPTLAGAFSFGLSFVNNDADENPYNFTVSGTGTGTPEIAVAETGLGQGAIADGGTLAQGSRAAGTPVNLTFTVTNSGFANLTLATASSSGATNVTVNSIGAPGSGTVAGGGGTTTFTVQYTPTLAGAFSFDLSFVNNDSDENPYNFTISGTATGAPEIAVSGSIGGAVADGGTLAQGNQTAAAAQTITFTVTNSGTDTLTLATATSSGPTNVTVNAITAPVSGTVAGGGATTTFTVQYTPTLAGAFAFDLSFVNNDSDENPYNFTVSGTGTGAPEIAVAETGLGQGAIADGGTLAQGNQAAGAAVNLTFTVTNSGTDALTLNTATSSGLTNVTVNAIGAPVSGTVAGGGGTTTFTVQYTPTLAGAFSFDLSFVNNDGDENPYNFTVSGTGTGAPEIAVSGSIGGAVAVGGTLAQGNQAAGAAQTITFTVTNSGLADLTLNTATSSAPTNVTVNAITAPVSGTVAGGGATTTFTVQYTPTLAGAFSFDLSFANNDGDENPYAFTVSGTGTGAPEIAVSGSIGGAVADGGTLAQGNQAAGSTQTITFTVTNSGLADLTLNTATSSGPTNVTVNAISAPVSGTVAGGGATTTFTVQYTPTLAGAFSFDLSFANNDGDENPYDITVSGTGTGAPEIAVSGSIGGAVADGGTLAQGNQTAGAAQTITFTVTNSGVGDLTLNTATSSGPTNVTVNAIGAPVSGTVAGGGGTTTFTVQYTPTLAGAFSFDLSFVNNDADENPYNFTVSGTGTGAPEIAVSGSIGGAVADGGTLAQGNQGAGAAQTITFTVTNSGTDNLTLATATSSGPSNVTVNAITAPVSGTVAGGGATTTFTVQYTPTLAGAFSFDLSFANNDADENPYNFTVSGTGTGDPEISVSGSIGGAVADGGTLAQGNQATGAAQTITFTVTNSGVADLTLNTATSSGLTNVTVNAISAPVSGTVAGGGGTTTFTVQYTPTLAGAFSFDLSFANNDADENPYDITVSGTGTGAPEIAVSGSIGGAVADGGTLAQGNQAAGAAQTITFTVTNSGTDALTLATATSSGPTNVTVNAITAPVSGTVAAAGGTTTFTVQYTPTLSGAFSFDLSFANNDADENPYNLTVSGTGTGTPEIDVSGSIGGAVADGGTLAQGNQAAAVAQTITFTVTNSGLGDLILNTATSSGPTNVTVNAISAPASTTVAGGGATTTFTVQYTPTLAGAFSFDLSFVNNDADENPYNFTVSGTGLAAPEIAVSGSIGGPVADGGTLAQGNQAVGGAQTITFTVTNSGLADLTLATATASGPVNVTVNAITAPLSATVAGGATTTFTVQYTPTAAGAFAFDLSFANNDADENPYDVTVSGTGAGTPEIAVSGSIGGAVADGGVLAQGNQAAGSAQTITFTVTNSGTDTLTLTTATTSGPTNVTVNAIGAPASGTVAGGGGTTTFTVQYTPTLAGAFSFDLSFANNDADENPYNFTVSGTGTGAAAPSVTSVTTQGLVTGGIAVTITGTGFTGATAVKFGVNPAVSFIVVNDTTITAVAPPGTGTVDVSVTAPGGTSPTAGTQDDFTYPAAPDAITFGPVPTVIVGSPPFSIVATAASGKPVTLSTLTVAVCTVAGNTVTITGPGTCTITGVTVASPEFAAATASVSFTVELRPDPSKDPEVLGIVAAQDIMAQQFAQAQINNFSSRLESIRDDDEGYAESQINTRIDLAFAATPRRVDEERVFGYATDPDKKTDRQSSRGKSEAMPAGATGGPEYKSPFAVWTGGSILVDDINNGSGLTITTKGLSAGIDYRISRQLSLGVGVGYGIDKSEIGSNGTTVRGTNYNAVVYGSFRPAANTFVDFLAGYGTLDFDINRAITGTNQFATGQRSGDEFFGQISTGLEFRGQDWLISPYARLNIISGQLDPYTEAAADPTKALRFDAQSFQSVRADIGMRAKFTRDFDFGRVSPFARVEYHHELSGSGSAGLSWADLNNGPTYTIAGERSGTDRILFGLGVDAEFYDYLLALEYQYARGTSQETQGVRGRLGRRF